jgi:hypothetical protein
MLDAKLEYEFGLYQNFMIHTILMTLDMNFMHELAWHTDALFAYLFI